LRPKVAAASVRSRKSTKLVPGETEDTLKDRAPVDRDVCPTHRDSRDLIMSPRIETFWWRRHPFTPKYRLIVGFG
jgi:hypothetical protein